MNQQIQLSVDPNHYAISTINIGSSEEDFYFAITSGNQVRQFLASPKHAKRILLLLQQQIDLYEKQYGKLETELPKAKEGSADTHKKMGF